MECWVVHNIYDGANFIFTDRDKLENFLGAWAIDIYENGGDLKEIFSEISLSKEELNPDFK